MLYSNGFDVKILSSVEVIGQKAWDYLAKDRAFASYRCYRFGETVLADDTPIYILLSRHGETVARATLWLTRQEPLPIPSKIGRYFLETPVTSLAIVIVSHALVVWYLGFDST